MFVTNTLTTYLYNGTSWIPWQGTAILQNGNTLGSAINIGSNDNQNLTFRTSGQTRMLISGNTGNVGIGTTNPTARLTVSGGTNSGVARIGEVRLGYVGITLNSSSAETNYNIISSSADTTLYINRPSTADIRFRENNVDQVTIKGTTGNVGIGTSSPRSKLEVSGNTIITGDLVVSGITGTTWFSGNSSSDLVRVTQTGSGNALVVQDLSNPDGTPFVITNDGSVGIGEPAPDARLSIVPSTIPSSNTNIGIKVEVGGSGSTGTVLNVSGSGTTTGLSITSTSSNSTANGIIVNSGVNVFNEVGDATSDFRIEGDTDPNLFFVDASADDIGIGTNSPTRKLTVSGDYTFIHNPVTGLTSSVSGYGDVVTFGTGSLTAGNLYYFTSGGAWSNADADSTSLSTGLLGIALGTTATTSGVLIRGYVRSTGYTASTGSKLYVSPTAGSITSTAPSFAGQILRIIGYQLNSTNNVVYFNPSNDWIEL